MYHDYSDCPNGQQILIVLFPRPGTDTREKLDLLRVIGTQTLAGTLSDP